MRYKHILYPGAIEKLNSSGIAKRVDNAVSSYDIGILGFIYGDEVREMVKEIADSYSHIPPGERKAFQEGLGKVFASPEDYSWRTNRFGGEVATEPVEMEDFPGLTGWWSSQVLNPKEVFDYERFGFRNITDFTGSVAALINERLRSRSDHRAGYKWQHVGADGKVYANEIGGDGNCDLRINRDDITPYETFDPLDNPVSFRPGMDADRSGAAPGHSTEDSFLAGVLYWVDQTGIKAETLEDKASETIRWARSLGQGGGTCAEHFFGASDEFRRIGTYLAGGELPHLDEKNQSKRMSTVYLVASGGDQGYGMYVGGNGELVLTTEKLSQASSPEKRVAIQYDPSEADHLIRGMLFQAAKGLGRTSAAQLISMLEYRFSPQWDADLKEMISRN